MANSEAPQSAKLQDNMRDLKDNGGLSIADYARRLHDSVMSEVSAHGADRMATRYDPNRDLLLNAAKKTAAVMDKRSVNPANGPTAIRERFTSNYWRQWNQDLVLLEGLSKKEQQKPTDCRPKLKSLRPKRCRGRGILFASNQSGPEKQPSKWPAHMTVKDIITTSLGEKISTYHPEVDGILDPYSIGLGRVKGAATSTSVAHEMTGLKLDTSMCDMPPVDKLRSEKGAGKFLGASTGRMSIPVPQIVIRAESTDPPELTPTGALRTPGPKFSRDSRFSDDMKGSLTPGPGSYRVPRLFDAPLQPSTTELISKLTADEAEAQKPSPLYDVHISKLPPVDRASVIGFGYGCDRQQHVLYGMCLDGMCGRRAVWEQVIMRGNDVPRAVGLSTADDLFCSEVEMPMENEMSALHAAVCRNDHDAIRRLKFARHHVNKIDRQSGCAPIHAIVMRRELNTLDTLIDVFGNYVDINLQDIKGDTPLHIACRLGYEDAVGVLCDYGAIPNACKNVKGQYPLDVAKSHAIHQIVNLRITELNLRDELESLRATSRKSSRA